MVNLEQCAIIIRQICDATEPGKKMVQKLFYLMERKGLQLNLGNRQISRRMDTHGIIVVERFATFHYY